MLLLQFHRGENCSLTGVSIVCFKVYHRNRLGVIDNKYMNTVIFTEAKARAHLNCVEQNVQCQNIKALCLADSFTVSTFNSLRSCLTDASFPWKCSWMTIILFLAAKWTSTWTSLRAVLWDVCVWYPQIWGGECSSQAGWDQQHSTGFNELLSSARQILVLSEHKSHIFANSAQPLFRSSFSMEQF